MSNPKVSAGALRAARYIGEQFAINDIPDAITDMAQTIDNEMSRHTKIPSVALKERIYLYLMEYGATDNRCWYDATIGAKQLTEGLLALTLIDRETGVAELLEAAKNVANNVRGEIHLVEGSMYYNGLQQAIAKCEGK
ncbi:hypothetical protein LCGC14_1612950 [marine sediment metagenome]|uniref:Uncharacterized protein n=1 Tax=marine sediment metagenome TaxID=412755 RepID=A0A0F9I7Z8_9ZZZZ